MEAVAEPAIETKKLSKVFGNRKAVDNVTIEVPQGAFLSIFGPNGAGKTTLLRVIQGLQKPSAGRVKIGQTVRFAVLSQHLDGLSDAGDDRVRQVIGRYSRRTMLDGKEMTPAQLLEKLGFSRADLNEPVRDLSGGQRRRCFSSTASNSSMTRASGSTTP